MGNHVGGLSKSHKTLENLILMGDSILDNFYGCNDHKKDVEHQLMETFKNAITITNLALCETTVLDILQGKIPNQRYINSRKQMGLSNYQIDNKDGKFYPLKILTTLIQSESIIVPPSKEDYLADKSGFSLTGNKSPKSPKNTTAVHSPSFADSSDNNNNNMSDNTLNISSNNSSGSSINDKNNTNNDNMANNTNSKPTKIKKKDIKSIMRPIVVLSVGLNDIMNHLSYGQFDLIVAALEENNFKDNFEKIVRFLVKNLSLEVILVLCFEPHESFFESQLHFSRDDLTLLMEWFAKHVFKQGELYQLPVIDLSRTFNPFNKLHYGSSATQPSNKGGQMIVDLIVHILEDFEFDTDNRHSTIYYGTGNDIQSQICDKTARGGYLRELNKMSVKDQMGNNELELLDDLFNDMAAESKDNDKTDDVVETKQRKFSFLNRKTKSNTNSGDANATINRQSITNNNNNNNGKTTLKNNNTSKDDDKQLNEMINEATLTDDLKFFSKSYDTKPIAHSTGDYATQTRARNQASLLLDSEKEQKLKTYSFNNNNDNTTTTDINNNNSDTNTAKNVDPSNVTRGRAQAKQSIDKTKENNINNENNNNNNNNSDNIEYESRQSRRVAVANLPSSDEQKTDNVTRQRVGYDASS